MTLSNIATQLSMSPNSNGLGTFLMGGDDITRFKEEPDTGLLPLTSAGANRESEGE